MTPLFRDRRDAGRSLAATLLTCSNIASEPVVLALPRGGVPVGFEVAQAFKAPLDVCIAQPLEVPGRSGLSMGAIASGQVLVLMKTVIDSAQISEQEIARVVKKEARDLGRRERAYRGERGPTPFFGRTVILVDDGLASVAAPLAAIAAIRARSPARLVVAMPVASQESYHHLLALVDDLVCLAMPAPFHGVATWYREFPQVSDLDVRRMHGEAVTRAQHWSFPH